MMFKTHVVIALLISLLIFPFFSLNKGIFLIIFLFGALFPDIDTPTSFIGKRLKIIGWLFKHRGIFHSLFMALLLSGLIFVYDKTYGVVFFLGYMTHLIIDMLNYSGIALFYPISSFKIKGFMKSNGIGEKIIFILCLVLGFWLLLK